MKYQARGESAREARGRRSERVRRLVLLALFAALVAVLQIFLGQVKVGPTSFSFVLVPIVMGAILLGPLAGAALGLVFGVITVAMGATGADPFTAALLAAQPVLTSLICLLKGTAAGFLSGVVYRAARGKAPPASRRATLASVAAAGTAPIVNTGIFIVGGATLLHDSIAAAGVPDGQSVLFFLAVVVAGVNFLAELAVNLLLSPVLTRVVAAVGDKVGKVARPAKTAKPAQPTKPAKK